MEIISNGKLEEIKLNKDNCYIVMDFCRTTTGSKSVSTWQMICFSNLLGDKCYQEYHELKNKYMPTDSMTDVEQRKENYRALYKGFIDLFYQYHLTNDIVKKSVEMTDVRLRDGAEIFFQLMYEKKIPIIIYTGGLKNTVIEYLTYYHSYYDNIYVVANHMNLDGDKQDVIYHITPHDKGMSELPEEVKNKINGRENIILIGDVLADISMVKQEDINRTIKIAFLDKDKHKEKNVVENLEENIKKYKEVYDLILVNEATFFDIIELLHIN